MLVEKYKPKRLAEVVGQKIFIQKIIEYLKNWKPGKALMLYGPTGIGKTLLAEIVARENKFNLIEINTSDNDVVSYIKKVLLPSSKEGSLFNKKLVLIDDIDSFSDRGLVTEIIKFVKESSNPVIITATDAYDIKLRALRNYCILVRVNRINVNLIEKELKRIALKEKIRISEEIIRRISLESDGDIRAAINELEVFSKDTEIGIRDRKKDIFKTLKTIFQSNNIREALHAMNESDKNVDDILWWIEQNIPNEFKDPKEVAEAFDLLSRADLFRSKIMIDQNYRYQKYMRDMIAGIATIGKNKKFIMYKPPDRLIMLGKTKALRAENEELYENIGSILHCSKRKVKEQMPYLSVFLK